MKRRQRTRPVTYRDLVLLGEALAALRQAHERLRRAGAVNAAIYVARALKSADGAHRHAVGCYHRPRKGRGVDRG